MIVARECFVEGPVNAENLEELFNIRNFFLEETYAENSDKYAQKVIPEFQKIIDLNQNCEINLWFEQDLFCQINLWFVSHLVRNYIDRPLVFLVKPDNISPFGFGGLNHKQLLKLLSKRQELNKSTLNNLSTLWDFYQEDNISKMKSLVSENKSELNFTIEAIEAHASRIAWNHSEGLPYQLIRSLIKKYGKNDFSSIFKKFNKEAFIYGYGDLQVRRIFDEIITTTEEI